MSAAVRAACAACGTELAPSLLACPQCRALVHAETLRGLTAAAREATARGDRTGALARWRDALALLPPDTRQHATIAATVDALSREVSLASPATPGGGTAAAGAGARRGAWAAVVAVLLFALTKGKLLLAGLTKLGTLSSMLVFLGVYWSIYGWRFALGFVVCLYIHEMGHVAALARYGIPASMPMFIPGLGAYVRLHQAPANVHEDARVGLAGPVWGLGATLAAWAAGLATGAPIWNAIAHTSAFLNLFNLLPVWQLDGGRGFQALSRAERWIAVAGIAAAFAWSREPLLLIVGAGAVWSALRPAGRTRDAAMLALYLALVAALTGLMRLAALTPEGLAR